MMDRFINVLLISMIGTSALAQDTLRVQVHGTVVNAGTDALIYEALVEWVDEAGNRQAITQTNSDGAYALFVRTTGQLELRVEENGYQAYVETLRIHPGECAHEHVIRLVPDQGR